MKKLILFLIVASLMILSSTGQVGAQYFPEGTIATETKNMNRQQIIDEICRLSKQDQYCFTFFDNFKFIILHWKIKKMRTAYNNAVISFLTRNHIISGDTDAELDAIWSGIQKKMVKKYQFLLMINGPILMEMEGWHVYKIEVIEYINKLCIISRTRNKDFAELI